MSNAITLNLDDMGIDDGDDLTSLLQSYDSYESLRVELPNRPMTLLSDLVDFGNVKYFQLIKGNGVEIHQVGAASDARMWNFSAVRNLFIDDVWFTGSLDSSGYELNVERALIQATIAGAGNLANSIVCRGNFRHTPGMGFRVNGSDDAGEVYRKIDIQGVYLDSCCSSGCRTEVLRMHALCSDPDGYAHHIDRSKARTCYVGRAKFYDVDIILAYGETKWLGAGTEGIGGVKVASHLPRRKVTGEALGDLPGILHQCGKTDTALDESEIVYELVAINPAPSVKRLAFPESSPGPTNFQKYLRPYSPELDMNLFVVSDEGSNPGRLECYGHEIIDGNLRTVNLGPGNRVSGNFKKLTFGKSFDTPETLFANGAVAAPVVVQPTTNHEDAVVINGGVRGARLSGEIHGPIVIENPNGLRTSFLLDHVESTGATIECDNWSNVLIGKHASPNIDLSTVPATSKPFACLEATHHQKDVGKTDQETILSRDFVFDVNGNRIKWTRYNGTQTAPSSNALLQATQQFDRVTGIGELVSLCSSDDILGGLYCNVGSNDLRMEMQYRFLSGGLTRFGFIIGGTHENNGRWVGIDQTTGLVEVDTYNYQPPAPHSYSIPGGVAFGTMITLAAEYDPAAESLEVFLDGMSVITVNSVQFAGSLWGVKGFGSTGTEHLVGPGIERVYVTPRTDLSVAPY